MLIGKFCRIFHNWFDVFERKWILIKEIRENTKESTQIFEGLTTSTRLHCALTGKEEGRSIRPELLIDLHNNMQFLYTLDFLEHHYLRWKLTNGNFLM